VNIAEIPATNLRTFKRFNFKLSNPHFSRLFIIFMIASIVRSLYQMAQPIFPIFLSNLGISVPEVSIIYSSASIVSMITPIIFGKLSDKFGRKKLLILGTLIAGIYALQGFWTLTFSQALTMKLFDALSLAIITPISLAFLTELLPSSQKGLGIGLYNSILRLDSSALGAVGGILVQLYGFNMLFLVGIVASIISSVIILIYIPEKHKIRES
jgi:MFS family permease